MSATNDSLLSQAFAWQCRQWSSKLTSSTLANDLAEFLGGEVVTAVERGDSCLNLESLPNHFSLEQLQATQIIDCSISNQQNILAKLSNLDSDNEKELEKTDINNYLLQNINKLYRTNFPLLYDGVQRLYLSRCYAEEMRIAAKVLTLAHQTKEKLQKNKYLNTNSLDIDRQKLAVNIALNSNLCIISGGPGTGKTWVTGQILKQLLKQNQQLTVALCAPTGKAAQRLQESLQKQFINNSELDNKIVEKFTTTCTVHRLLGINSYIQLNRVKNKTFLHYDLVIIDEASMLDLELADILFAAISPDTKVIILGDKNQLDAVEHGLVFSALLDLPQLEFCRVELQKNHRFKEGSPISKLALAVNQGDKELALQLFSAFDELSWIDSPTSSYQLHGSAWFSKLLYLFINYQKIIREILQFDEIEQLLVQEKLLEQIFICLNDFRILTVLRHGKLGVNNLNQKIALALNPQFRGAILQQKAFSACPILIQENQAHNNLSNGDIGICLADTKGTLWTIFPNSKQANGEKFFAKASSLLPRYEYAYAITVHKAQGSEFNHVALVLPEESSELLSRQMIYTAITRSRLKLTVIGNKNIFALAIANKNQRFHGLDNCFMQIEKMINQKNTNNFN